MNPAPASPRRSVPDPILPMDRRQAIKWMLAATATAALWDRSGAAVNPPAPAGYGTDPDLVKDYRPGDLWPLTFDEHQRRTAAALCALIIPADSRSPSAADLDVQSFIDEWVSAPYPQHTQDRELILEGFRWLDVQAQQRFSRDFYQLDGAQQTAICDQICYVPPAPPELLRPARFFARYRDLTAGGFYTTPEGSRDIGYVGNVASLTYDGPPPEVRRLVGV